MNMEVFSSLQDAALQRQAEPIVAYIRDNFKEAEVCPILGWIVEKVEDDDFIISIYDQLEALGQDVFKECGRLQIEGAPTLVRKKWPRASGARGCGAM